MKSLILCVFLALLTGCNSQKNTQLSSINSKPAGIIKLLENDTGGTYADLRNISSYQGNTHLRRFSIINNYAKPGLVRTNPPIYISSSTIINVVNCDIKQRVQFERLFFTQYWGEGDVVAARDTIGQWEAYPDESLIGLIANSICGISPTRLKPELPREARRPLL